MKILATTATCAVALASSVITCASSSSADSAPCSLQTPSKVSIWSASQNVTLRAEGDCIVGAGYADWSLRERSPYTSDWVYTEDDQASFSQNFPTHTWVVDGHHDLGVMKWTSEGAADAAGNGMGQNDPLVDIRLYGAAWVAAVHSGNKVTLTGTSLVYSPDASTFVRRPGTTGVFQYRDKTTGGAWKTLKEVKTTGANATASWSYNYSGSREYRFATYSTPSVWSISSASVTR